MQAFIHRPPTAALPVDQRGNMFISRENHRTPMLAIGSKSTVRGIAKAATFEGAV